jgi:hypothetical protein
MQDTTQTFGGSDSTGLVNGKNNRSVIEGLMSRSVLSGCIWTKSVLWTLFALLAGASFAIAQNPSTRPIGSRDVKYGDNGAWIGYGYLSGESYWSQVPKVALQMSSNYRVRYWFLNVGTLDATGKLKGSVSSVTNFLNTLNTWENQEGYQFKLVAWLNASSTKVDITDATVRSNIVGECQKLVSKNVPGSYVAGANRTFDGMQLDLEPIGQDANQSSYLMRFFDQVRAGFHDLRLDNKLTSFTPSKCGTRNIWWSSPEFYYTLGRHLDLLCAMTYDTGITTGSVYQSWVQDQTTNILDAVSGKLWNNDAQHPAPTNGVKLMIGFPSFPTNTYHDKSVENILYAAHGVKAGLADLQARGDASVSYFKGVAVYAHTDGTGKDGYADNETDWQSFRQEWLKAW